jgi:adenylate cyclase
MPPQPGGAEKRRVGRRARSALPDEVRAVLAAADLAAERTAARVRLGVLVLIGVLLAALGSLSGVYRREIALIFALNAGVSVAAVVLARPGMFRSWVPWTVATLDAAVVLGIMIYGDLNERMSASYTPALAVSWAMFVLLGLTAIRFKPALVLYLGGLFVCGMALVIGFHSTRAAPVPLDPSGADLARLFDPEHNAVRLFLIALTACVLAVTVGRGRRTLVEAVIAARRSTNLSRYFSSGLAPLLADAEVEVLKRGRRQPGAILFADIRGFTAMSEQLEPAAIAEFLASFRSRATRAIERHGGIVDKFVGDDVMGVFGVPIAAGAEAANALAAGRALLAEIEAWNDKRGSEGRRTVSIGIGIHYGEVFAGVIGDAERLEFTVIGDAVNTARRIEELTKPTGWAMLVSSALIEAAGPTLDHDFQPLPLLTLRGRRAPVRLFAYGGYKMPHLTESEGTGHADLIKTPLTPKVLIKPDFIPKRTSR